MQRERQGGPEIVVTADGSRTLRSAAHGQTFKSRHGALSESRAVFLQGSGVAARLAAGRSATVLEIGFGAGLNFLVTASMAVAHGSRLHYVAIETDLPSSATLAALDYPGALAPSPVPAALLRWRETLPETPGPGWHRFRHDLVTLDLWIGDATEPLALSPLAGQGRAGVDAIYHDAFSPAVVPPLWSPSFLTRLAGVLAPGGALVSYTVAGVVRRALTDAGLVVRKVRGPVGGKREVLVAERPSDRADQDGGGGADDAAANDVEVDDAGADDVGVLVVGAGIAGASVAFELARRGADVLVVERGRVGMQGASSLPAALLNPHRGRTARATATDLAGLTAFWQTAAALEADGLAAGARRTGVLRVPTSGRQARDWQRIPDTTWLEPRDVPSAYDAPYGAMWIPDGGWVEPAPFLAALSVSAARHGARLVEGTRVVALTCEDDGVDVTLMPASGVGAGRAVRAAHVVLCIGAATVDGLRLPRFERAEGAAVTLAMASSPPYPLAGSVNAAFESGHAVVTGGHVPAGTADPERLRAALARFVPEAAHARVLSTWTGVRVRRASGVPVARRLHPRVTLFGAMAGRGFLTAAWYARRIAERLA